MADQEESLGQPVVSGEGAGEGERKRGGDREREREGGRERVREMVSPTVSHIWHAAVMSFDL
jgi:hypothetical protein